MQDTLKKGSKAFDLYVSKQKVEQIVDPQITYMQAKLDDQDSQIERLADEYDSAVTQLNEAIKARNTAQIAEQLWHDNKDIYATLLEQRAR